MLSFFLLALIAQATRFVASQQLPTNIFILAGQSNMAGRGGVINDTKTGKTTWDGIVPPQCQPNPSIFRLSADLIWVPAHEPLHADIDYNKTNGVGPGMAFANAILTEDPTIGVLGLVPCAIGGTNISQWAKGGFLYEQLVRRTQVALRSGGALRAMLWYQGESDTINREDADSYKSRLEKFFLELRSDLQYPLLPIIQVALASAEGPFTETIRETQLGIKLANVKCVDAKGLPLEPDRLHLTTPAQVQLGQTLANAFLHSPPNAIRTSSDSNFSTRLSCSLSYHLVGLILISILIFTLELL
ncbi:probable carbohydrate esterase At4g34215 [Jatropha curcas]|uniref:probable carbohydrate esterase At4g34215 n=1 Tax=Jatropha curcas TaxID=180498 RepID=UPI0005FA974D|nr:probable carbohydrate esterase At4g34215 [Jatropha curcas]